MYLVYMMFQTDDSQVFGKVFNTKQEAFKFFEKKYFETYGDYDEKKLIKRIFKETVKKLENNEDLSICDGDDYTTISFEIHISNINDLKHT